MLTKIPSPGSLILLPGLLVLSIYVTFFSPEYIFVRPSLFWSLEAKHVDWKDDLVFNYTGAYTPYMMKHVEYYVPAGCEITQVTILQRHMSRYPTEKGHTLIQAALNKVVAASGSIQDQTLLFIKNFKLELEEGEIWGDLTAYGRTEAYDAGRFYRNRYKVFAGKIADSVFIRSSGSRRTTESGRHFSQGYHGTTRLPSIDLVMEKETGMNNSLSVSTCASESDSIDLPGVIIPNAWIKSKGLPIASRLNSLIPGANLTPVDTLALMSLCGFDSVRPVKGRLSPWCNVFTLDEWKSNEYFYDLSKYYSHSYGSPFGKTKGISYLNELVARLTDTSDVVQGGASNMSSLAPPGGRRIFIDMSHDNTMVSILAALGYPEDGENLPPKGPPPVPSPFIVSSVVPFGARIVFERLTCGAPSNFAKDDNIFLRTFVNDVVQKTSENPSGLVSLKNFLKSEHVRFGQSGGNWAEKCFDSQSILREMDNDDYWSIDAIIADNQKLPCTFQLDVQGLGYLDGGNESDIKELAKSEIPFWLVQTLAINDFVTFNIPQAFSNRVRNALNAESRSVKLSNLVGGLGMWYGFGRRLVGILDDPQATYLSTLLLTTFKFRAPEIQDQAQHAASITSHAQASLGSGTGAGEFRDGLEGEERELFAIAQDSARRMKHWYDSNSSS
ncbi:Multiple inositol polyphosphate phosphatase [Phaffia rhodozyma]|uniref:Multiple inositol polyphosphate phosphatase n=1 Tax=Phaffia rhodozyma TaxID=264483 RepID=A0A0F7SYC0_PHARH|nr:Multiple inositol polyphosphate phosphatase [Phaffia rhodozyma]